MSWRPVASGLLVLVLAACATKRYARVAPLSDTERELYTCREIELEIAKVNAMAKKIKKDAGFDGLSVLSFLTDYGIGNMMEHNQAMNSVRTRYRQLKALETEKQCKASAAPADANTPAPAGTPAPAETAKPTGTPAPASTPAPAPATEKR